MKLSNKAYDILKVIALIVLPNSEFVSAIGGIWGLPICAELAATLVALDALLGTLLKISSDNYHGVAG